jgi:uncharacterized membrane protein
MSKNFQKAEQLAADVLVGWSVYTLSGPGLVVIWLALIGWFIEGTFGWIAVFLYLVALVAAFWLTLQYIIFRIKRDSKFFGNKPLDRD